MQSGTLFRRPDVVHTRSRRGRPIRAECRAMDVPSPTPRRVSKPRWLDVRLVLGIVLVLAAVLVGAVVISRAKHTEKQVAVTHDLAAGSTLRNDDLAAVDVRLPDSAHVYLDDPASAIGKVVNEPIGQGELLPTAALDLTRGQRIVVWLSTDRCPSVVLLPDVTVQDVHAADSGTFATVGTGQSVVLSMTPDLADRVVTALAMTDATIRAGVLTGTERSQSGRLANVAACATS
jgi:hypothetical protein